jgi:D-alanyl-D-alanine carboxypeptidase
MLNKKLFIILICLAVIAPNFAHALQMPEDANDLASMADLNAQAYIVEDVQSGQVLISKNADMPWTPASLTKLVTALVVLDTKTSLSKSVAMTTADQTAGFCSSGGVCIKTKPGVKFTVDGLFHAALMPSANNAANALARSTGLTKAQFVAKMNAKVIALGATNTHFNEPTGMDPSNQITAGDYAKIVAAAFSNPYLSGIAELNSYNLNSTNNYRYDQTIKNLDNLLGDPQVTILGAKTGYLTESDYNFASLLKNGAGEELAVVVLGEDHLYTAFAETKELADLAWEASAFAFQAPAGAVLGESTQSNLNN